MATAKDWIGGARLRTLPAAVAPVLVGSAAAHHLEGLSAGRAGLALIVALALQVGVNYSNDYSDGVRGTDAHRAGPARLTGGGLAAPRMVLAAALGCFAVAGAAGLALVAWSGQWWLLLAGAAAVVAAWFYTGGRSPYGYMGVGVSELMVFVFFGLMACVGTTWTQTPQAPWWLWMAASALGLGSVALLMVNNIRDIPTDREAGKKTVAVRLGERGSRAAYAACLAACVVALGVLPVAVGLPLWTGVAASVVAAAGAAVPLRPVLTGATGRALIPALRDTGFYLFAWGAAAATLLSIA
ncbi:1,4-dihydroxy-2-naphthoate polyprenyltransferase [Actinomyces sp. B33]|uniref:1,4-dihydroxy-2-naphthoate polyprenyltransferase n=1 Tax=Actinomyces sp. B33 TaxID=2942131 RepID=UPI0023405CFD|nr:1,4-dihydroxy-2-naphthoate polyprenyltransferase [Actinomyces sp. B33]MDC4233531.1 1,4-dihydroxy-2-naphthoate polyprenyltransferase [Actinomyces sp. B33]